MKKYIISFTIILLLALVTGAQAQKATDRKVRELGSDDKTFVVEAAQLGIGEIALGQLAVQKATKRYIKVYGQRMIDDYTSVNKHLKEFSDAFGVALPTDMNPKQKADFTRLSGLSGTAFDQEYIKTAGIDSHTGAKTLFHEETEHGKEKALRAFAMDTLPVILSNLNVAKDINLKFEAHPKKT